MKSPQIFIFLMISSSCQGALAWESLLDEDLSQFEVFTGVPHTSVEVKWPDKADDVRKNGKAMGLGDPLKLYQIETDGKGEPILKISGQVFGSLCTKKSYGNYRLRAEVKWGKDPKSLASKASRDTGIIYHSYGPYGKLWNTWKLGLEFQIQDRRMGDLIKVGRVSCVAPCLIVESPGERPSYHSREKWQRLGPRQYLLHREVTGKELDDWNKIELIVFENSVIHLLNGKVVNVAREIKLLTDGEWRSKGEGQIQIQSVESEVFYRKLRIKKIESMPPLYRRYLRNAR